MSAVRLLADMGRPAMSAVATAARPAVARNADVLGPSPNAPRGPADLDRARRALESGPPPREYAPWRDIGWAYQAAGGEYVTFREWSARDGDKFQEDACLKVWNSFEEKAGGIGEGTLYRWARSNGWTDDGEVVNLPEDTKPGGSTTITREGLELNLPDWRLRADGTKGAPLPTTANVHAAARVTGCNLRYNQMARSTEIAVPGLKAATDDYQNTAYAHFGDRMVRCGLGRDGLKPLTDAVATQNPYHPVREWIDGIPWDGVPRTVQLHKSFELRDPAQAPLRAKLIDAWAISAVAAIYRPDGVAAQGILVLAGPQGIGKTRGVESLCAVPGSVRTGLHVDPGDRDSVFKATGAWIVELGELDSTVRRAEVSALKAFITSPEDILRRPYAVNESTYPRRTVFVGTVNGTGFLADDTGSRRFWVLNVVRCDPLPAETMQQIWAEYRVRYEQGAPWFLDPATEAALRESNDEHHTVDPLREQILATFDWARTSEPGWIDDKDTRWLSATDICRVELNMYQPSKPDVTRAGGIVRSLNGGAGRRSGGARTLAVPPRTRRLA